MIDPNNDIVPTLRMFDGLIMGQAADEIERLRALLASYGNAAQAAASAEPVGSAIESMMDPAYTIATFNAKIVPAGSKLYAAPVAAQPSVPTIQAGHTPPYSNCSFRLCDLPGQCRSEGKCHHPTAAPTPPADGQAQQDTDKAMGFKNFHRLLCDRFDYCHDERDWQRDQLSLIEHIAKKISGQDADKADAARYRWWREYYFNDEFRSEFIPGSAETPEELDAGLDAAMKQEQVNAKHN